MKNRLLLGCGLLFGFVFVFWWLFGPYSIKHKINLEGYRQLRLGMTEQEVESVLGVPAGDYGPGKGEILDYGVFTIMSHEIKTDPNGKKWLAGSFAITVCFDDQGRVRGMGTDEVYRPYDSPLEMLCQKTGLSKKKPYPAGAFNGLFGGE
jgi:hypothetical protein